jgi:hypothetical protein
MSLSFPCGSPCADAGELDVEEVRVHEGEDIRHLLAWRKNVEEKQMFSGVGFVRKGAGGVLTRFATVLAVHP